MPHSLEEVRNSGIADEVFRKIDVITRADHVIYQSMETRLLQEIKHFEERYNTSLIC